MEEGQRSGSWDPGSSRDSGSSSRSPPLRWRAAPCSLGSEARISSQISGPLSAPLRPGLRTSSQRSLGSLGGGGGREEPQLTEGGGESELRAATGLPSARSRAPAIRKEDRSHRESFGFRA